MSKYHDKWYTRIFSDPRIVEDLLKSFVHEDFIHDVDFKTLKKLSTKFIKLSDEYRHSDVIYEVKTKGQTAYIYLFLEFQSTVDRFMPLRLGRYLFEFYEDIRERTGDKYLHPAFPIMIYSGDERWTAPTSFRELLHPSEIPEKYLPEFRYFKIAVNEIPKRELVKIRNAVAAVFYVENSSPEEIARNRRELIILLSAAFNRQALLS